MYGVGPKILHKRHNEKGRQKKSQWAALVMKCVNVKKEKKYALKPSFKDFIKASIKDIPNVALSPAKVVHTASLRTMKYNLLQKQRYQSKLKLVFLKHETEFTGMP